MKKNLAWLPVISFLFVSCFSYKTIDIKKTSLTEGKKYKLKTEQSNGFQKLTVKSLDGDSITVKKGGFEKQIAVSDVKSAKIRKFSLLKSIAFTPLVIVSYLIVKAGIDTDGRYGGGQ